MSGPRDPRTPIPSLSGPPASAGTFVLELPTTSDFAPGGMGHQCAVLCKAGCCRYYSLPLETPRTDAQFDDLRWYLMHESTHVYKSEGDWFLLVLNECKNLLPNNLCGIYDTRPRICREYDPTDCEFTGEVKYELYFDSATKLEEWIAERKARRIAAAAASPRRRKADSTRGAKVAKVARSRKRA